MLKSLQQFISETISGGEMMAPAAARLIKMVDRNVVTITGNVDDVCRALADD